MANKNIGRARILQEIKNMQKDKVQYLHAQPLQTDLYTWHFTFRGPQNTDFHQGLYHGQILLPFQYPFKPPDIIFANKNGRFQVNTKICLTITQYHTQQWNSAWTIRTMLEAVISLFNQKVIGHGYLQSSGEARRFFAKASHQYTCQKCGKINSIVKPREPISKQKQIINKNIEQKKVEQSAQGYQYHDNAEYADKIRKQSINRLKEIQEKIKSTELKKDYKQQNKQEKKSIKINNQKQKQSQRNIKQKNTLLNKNKEKNLDRQNKKNKKSNKFISPQQFFYESLMYGNQQYLSVVKSKKLISQ